MNSTLVLGATLLLGGTPGISQPGTLRRYDDTKPCVQLEVPVHVVANNSIYQVARVDSSIDAVSFMLDLDASDSPLNRTMRSRPVDETFAISVQLCVPPQGAKASVLQIATHGLTFDKRYWDSEYKPEDYSYVDAALAAGYSILTYDRLGVEILKVITDLARSGQLFSTSNIISGALAADTDYHPSTIIHVGHSYGSVITNLLLSQYPTVSDGTVLTGWMVSLTPTVSAIGRFALQYAPEADPGRFGDLGSGYMVIGSRTMYEYLFLSPRNLDHGSLEYYWGIRQTTTPVEVISAIPAMLTGRATPGFKGFVVFFLGERDKTFCSASTCQSSVNIDYLRSVFPDSSDVSVYLQPDTGHLLTSSLNATAGVEALFDHLEAQGL